MGMDSLIARRDRLAKKGKKLNARQQDKLDQFAPDENGQATRLSLFQAENNPDAAQASLIQLEQNDFENRLKPLEDELRSKITDSPEIEARKAGESAVKAQKLTRATFQRDLGRSGTELTGRQTGAIDRSQGLAEARGVATAKNVSRSVTRDQNMEAKQKLIGIGRDVSATGKADLASAAGLQANRENANRNAEAEADASRTSAIMTVAGIAAAFI